MKETGIIMSGNHPKLILDGIKTMTRRVIKPQPTEWQISLSIVGLRWGAINLGSLSRDHRGSIAENYLATLCPYGQVGDRLWVRETFRTEDGKVIYAADVGVDFTRKVGYYGNRYKPSIHMPRWASRITRDIALLRVEQLRDISEADAQVEGGYSIEEFIKLFIKINHLPEDANPWNWVIGW